MAMYGFPTAFDATVEAVPKGIRVWAVEGFRVVGLGVKGFRVWRF